MSEVLIAGAGPTGLLLAAELERRGVPCTLIDAHDAPLGWDRATIVHARSMEIFEALGLAARFEERGVKSGRVRIRSGGRTLGEVDLSAVESRYPFDLGISEHVTESILTDHLESFGGSVTRGARLVSIEPGPSSVAATIDEGGTHSEIEAAWLVGCDGFHSAVREQAGIGFPGSDIEQPWAVFDATLVNWPEEPEVQVAHLDVPPVILTPLPGNRWRVYVRPSSEESDLTADAAGVINAYFPEVSIADVGGSGRFLCHSRIASSYRAGRILLAGDAAHVCTPAEGHGMNTGLQDAFNLGWKLAQVCRGESPEELLDTYDEERRPVAEIIVGSGEAVEGAQTLTAEADRAERDEEIGRTFASLDSAHREAVASAEIERSYSSSIVAGDRGKGLEPGDRLPHTGPLSADEPRTLHELTHRPTHTLLVLGGPGASAAEVTEAAAALEEPARSPIVGATAALSLGATVAESLGIEGVTVLMVRPDGYVGLRADDGDPGAVRDYLAALSAPAADR